MFYNQNQSFPWGYQMPQNYPVGQQVSIYQQMPFNGTNQQNQNMFMFQPGCMPSFQPVNLQSQPWNSQNSFLQQPTMQYFPQDAQGYYGYSAEQGQEGRMPIFNPAVYPEPQNYPKMGFFDPNGMEMRFDERMQPVQSPGRAMGGYHEDSHTEVFPSQKREVGEAQQQLQEDLKSEQTPQIQIENFKEIVTTCFDQKFQVKEGCSVVPPSRLFKKLTDKTDDQIQQKTSLLLHKSKKIKSKYNNFTKLYLNTIFYLFKPANLDNIIFPEYLRYSLLQTIQRVKQSGKKRMGKQFKTDHFNHSHYNVLFLKITEHNIQRLVNSEKDRELHLSCFDVDLSKEDAKSKKVEFINIVKRAIFQIVKLCISQDKAEIGQDKLNVKQQYQQKVLLGIIKMAAGEMTLRF